MKNIVLYFTLSGNTKKLASAISKELECEMFDINKLSINEKKIFWNKFETEKLHVFLGSGCYANRVGAGLRRFLIDFLPEKPLNFSLFGTWVGRGNSGHLMMDNLKSYLLKRKQNIIGEPFLSFGKLTLIKMEHPNNVDLKNVRDWARNIVN